MSQYYFVRHNFTICFRPNDTVTLISFCANENTHNKRAIVGQLFTSLSIDFTSTLHHLHAINIRIFFM